MATNPMQRKARISFILGMLLTLLICGVIIVLLFMQINKANKFSNKALFFAIPGSILISSTKFLTICLQKVSKSIIL